MGENKKEADLSTIITIIVLSLLLILFGIWWYREVEYGNPAMFIAYIALLCGGVILLLGLNELRKYLDK